MSSELDRKFSSLRQVFEDLVIKKAALKWNTTVLYSNAMVSIMKAELQVAF
jgi:hypothetical protein